MEEQPPKAFTGARIDTGDLAGLDDAAFIAALRAARAADDLTFAHLIEWQRRPSELLTGDQELETAVRAQFDATTAAMRGALPTTELLEQLRSVTASWEHPCADVKGWAEQFTSAKQIPNEASSLNWAGSARPIDAVTFMADPQLEASHTLIEIVDQQRAESAQALGAITEILARQEAAGATAERINKWILGLTFVAAVAAVAGLVVAIIAP